MVITFNLCKYIYWMKRDCGQFTIFISRAGVVHVITEFIFVQGTIIFPIIFFMQIYIFFLIPFWRGENQRLKGSPEEYQKPYSSCVGYI